MRLTTGLSEADRHLAQQAGSRIPSAVGRLSAAAESSNLWWGAAVVMTVFGGRRGRMAAVSGLTAFALTRMVSHRAGRVLGDGPRASEGWIEHDEAADRPESSSFPSVHTAAAIAFTTAVTPAWPLAGAVWAVPATLLAVEGVHSGAQYPVDVAAGVVVGVGSARLTLRMSRLLRNWWQ